MIEGIDYSFSRPSPQEVKAAGKEFVCRYISGDFRHDDDGQKDLSIQERDALFAAGLAIVLVWETDGRTGPLAGGAAAPGDAAAAIAEARELGAPPGTGIYFAVDFGASAADAQAIRDYAIGVRDACRAAGYRAGIYGGLATEQDVADVTDLLWQTYAWSSGNWNAGAALRQYANGATVAGASVDLNSAMAADFGQWTIGGVQTPESLGGDMSDTLTLDWGAYGKGTHDFAAVSGQLRHDWDGGAGEIVLGENNELANVHVIEVVGVIQEGGTCRLQVRDDAGHRFRVYQGATEGTWHVQGEPI